MLAVDDNKRELFDIDDLPSDNDDNKDKDNKDKDNDGSDSGSGNDEANPIQVLKINNLDLPLSKLSSAANIHYFFKKDISKMAYIICK